MTNSEDEGVFEDFGNMSDEELQEAFAAGKLKPGLNIATEEKVYRNNAEGLKKKLKEFKLNLEWVEKLDLISKPAIMAPELHHELAETEKRSIVQLKNHVRPSLQGTDVVVNDFQREMLFHRQAQAAVLEGIERLNKLGIPTQRPDDYFAEMAKTDQHMQKIRTALAAKQAGAVRSEKIAHLRRLKKVGKQVQVERQKEQAAEKKKMLNEVKKYRKGIRKDLDFLEDRPKKQPSKKPGQGGKKDNVHNKKADSKSKKYGFGGKKKGSKRNTRKSATGTNFSSKHMKKQGGPKGGGGQKNKRLGKSKRIKMKSRK